MSNLRVGIIGTGYVGLVTGVCLGELGFPITCGDIIAEKIEKINSGIPPIYEKGLDVLLKKLIDQKLLIATLSTNEVVQNSDIILICTGTPSNNDGEIDLSYVKQAAKDIGHELSVTSSYKTVVVKSTVIPGTTTNVVKSILEESSGKKVNIDFGLGMNPEFLKEGLAIEDFKNPDRIIIGSEDDQAFEMISKLYQGFTSPILRVNCTTAEMIKYASNAFLAVKVSFINEISNICEKLGANISEVAKGMGLDKRISPKFLRPGLGFGGSCFPKDVKALRAAANHYGIETKILEASLNVNEMQPLKPLEFLENNLKELKDRKIAILGLAFKPDTDDVRESRAIPLITELLKRESIVVTYDPIAMEMAQKLLPNKTIYANSIEETLENADACILVTEWDEFKKLSVLDFSKMKTKIIYDGRRILDWQKLQDNGCIISVIGNPIK